MSKKMKLSLMLTTACNWSCEYCDIERVPNAFASLADVKYLCEELLPLVDLSNTRLELTGGEPGLAHIEVLEYLNEKAPGVYLCTNGTYVDKGYADKFSFTPYIHFELGKFKDYGTKPAYALVVTNENFVEALKFIKQHPDHNIFAIPCTVRADRNQHVSADYVKVFNTLSPKVADGSTRCWKQLAVMQDYAACSAYVGKPLIDLANRKIIRCCCMYEGNELEPLNKESFIRLFSGELYEPKPELCVGCCHVLSPEGM